jgi:hypothetical protein
MGPDPTTSHMTRFTLNVAASFAKRQRRHRLCGLLSLAIIATQHAGLAARSEWVINEKGIVEKAGPWEVREALLRVESSNILDARYAYARCSD